VTIETTNYRKFQSGNPLVRRLIDRFYDRITTRVAALAPENLLDAGCGEGETLARLAGHLPPRVLGFDILEPSVRFTAQRHPAPHVAVASIEAICCPDNTFDLVLCLEVLEHLPDPEQAVAELLRVSRRDVLISVPSEPWFRLGSLCRGKYLATWGNHPEHVNHWSPRTLRRFLAASAEVVAVEHCLPWIIAHCRPRS